MTASRSSARRPDTQEPAAPVLSPDERLELGRAARDRAPRSSHAEWVTDSRRADPIALLEEQASGRVPELVPIRYGRMAATPFAFFRGSAYVMASDLADTPTSGLRAQLCGDAHLSNFGAFASPERNLVFDLNDFDETLPGPWEWDVKRLMASIAVAGRDSGFSRNQRQAAVRAAVARYRTTMLELAGLGEMAIWYRRLGVAEIRANLPRDARSRDVRQLDKSIAKARSRDSARAFARLAATVDGMPRIVPDPPLIVPARDLAPAAEADALQEQLQSLIMAYRGTLPDYRRRLFDRYRYADMARKVVGVGSVGTRAWVVLLIGRDAGDPLFLQAKEAPASALSRFAGPSPYANQGRRVVEGQRLMQAASDIFLGWLESRADADGERRDFYVRQLWDWKGSVDIGAMSPSAMTAYGELCGWTLARAHARSGDPIAIAGYLGRGDAFDRALVEFAERYADQTERDHRALVDAIDSGRIQAQTGI
jgi:uncharacterized protein (DUF2252 family)